MDGSFRFGMWVTCDSPSPVWRKPLAPATTGPVPPPIMLSPVAVRYRESGLVHRLAKLSRKLRCAPRSPHWRGALLGGSHCSRGTPDPTSSGNIPPFRARLRQPSGFGNRNRPQFTRSLMNFLVRGLQNLICGQRQYSEHQVAITLLATHARCDTTKYWSYVNQVGD